MFKFSKLFLPLILFTLFIQTNAQNNNLALNDAIAVIKSKLNPRNLGRYMERTKLEITPEIAASIKGWDVSKLSYYEYTDTHENNLKAQVIMYNADPEKLANWIYYSLADSNKSVNETNIDKVINHLKNASGFQFPVRGVVYEDLGDKNGPDKEGVDHPDGISETYFFFDGVAVSHKTIKILTYKFSDPQRIKPEGNKRILQMTENDIEKVFLYGRISSTTREQLVKFMKFKYNKTLPNLEADSGKPFLKVIREEYISAMKSNRNNIISAWVYSNL